ncbi:MAG: response regulator transcription factor [Bacteroidia bacterium]
MINILLFDDNPKMLDSMSMLIDTSDRMSVCAAFQNVLHCEEEIKNHKPDLVLMDIDMPGLNGLDALKKVHKQFPSLPVLMLTSFEDEEKVFGALRNGARGYLLKNMPPQKILKAIEDAYAGAVPMSDQIANKVLEYFRQPGKGETDYELTERELEVLRHLVNGKSYQQAADEMIISYETVRTHVKHLYTKLGVSTLAEAVVKAVRENLVD